MLQKLYGVVQGMCKLVLGVLGIVYHEPDVPEVVEEQETVKSVVRNKILHCGNEGFHHGEVVVDLLYELF